MQCWFTTAHLMATFRFVLATDCLVLLLVVVVVVVVLLLS